MNPRDLQRLMGSTDYDSSMQEERASALDRVLPHLRDLWVAARHKEFTIDYLRHDRWTLLDESGRATAMADHMKACRAYDEALLRLENLEP